jgi:hypothetical protein
MLKLSSFGKPSSLISSLTDDASKLILTEALVGQDNFRLDMVSLRVDYVARSQTALDDSETNAT